MDTSKKRKITQLEDAENVFTKTKQILNDIMILKSGTQNDTTTQKQHELLKECTALFLELKHFNREISTDVERQRNDINKEKAKLDPRNLQLQNLLYQKEHLRQQIASCRDFKSKESELDLLSEEEVLKIQRERAQSDSENDGVSPLISQQNDHEKMLTRLNMELEMRKSLRVQIQELEARKKALTEVLSQKRKSMEALNNKFLGLKQNITSVQEYIQAAHPTKEVKNTTSPLSTADQLPLPLYTVYHCLLAFKDSSDNGMLVSLESPENHLKSVSPQVVVAEFSVESNTNENENSMKIENAVNIRFAHFTASNTVGCSITMDGEGHAVLGSLYSDDQGTTVESSYRSYRWLDNLAGTLSGKPPVIKDGSPVADLISRLKGKIATKNNKS